MVDHPMDQPYVLDTESQPDPGMTTTSGWESTLPRQNFTASKRPCDVCRKRKIKCIPFNLESDVPPKPGERCRGCENLDVKCSHDYVNKKPGRPLGSTKKLKEEREREAGKQQQQQQQGSSSGDLERDRDRGIKDESTSTSRDTEPSDPPGSAGAGMGKNNKTPILSMPSWNLPDAGLLNSAGEADISALMTPQIGRDAVHNSPFRRSIDIRPSYSDGQGQGQHQHQNRHPTPAYVLKSTSTPEDDTRSRGGVGGLGEMDLWPASMDRSAASSVVDAQSPYAQYYGTQPGHGRRGQGHAQVQGRERYDPYNPYGQSSHTQDPNRGIKRKPSHGPGDDILSPGRSVSSYNGGQGSEGNVNSSSDQHQRRSFSRRSSMSITRLIQGGANSSHDNSLGFSGNEHRRDDSGNNPARYAHAHAHAHPHPHPAHRDSFTSNRSDPPIDPSLEPSMDHSDAHDLSLYFPPSQYTQFTHPPLAQPPLAQIESVTTWVNIEFFIGLYLKHQHALVPLVHKPTFRADLLERRDRIDPEFRALLLSLVSYVICQVPVHRMTALPPFHTKSSLETLQWQCHNASKIIQTHVRKERWEKSEEPSLITLTILIIDYFYSQSRNDITGAATTLGEAARLAYVKKLHLQEWKNEDGSYDQIEDEIRKRIFWQLYNTDKTDACSGLPVMLHDFEKVPPWPKCTDDENISQHGMIDQLVGRPSYMMGFVVLSSLFQILGECLLLSRQHLARPKGDVEAATKTCSAWIENALQRIDGHLEDLPDVLRPGVVLDPAKDINEVFAVQRVNLMITAVFIKFELFRFQAELGAPNEQVEAQRKEESRKICVLLEPIHTDHIAMNGEAMRNKLMRIMLALSQEADFWNEQVKAWWDVYAQVQWVQVIPESKHKIDI